MARIRTVKPQLSRHRPLYDMEVESGLPMRFIWAMLPTICDREGRFSWRPWELKLDICPYDNFDFGAALDLLHKNGMLHKYQVGAEIYGSIPTFKKHQQVNTRESASVLPEPDSGKIIDPPHDMCMHEPEHVQDSGEGKGREGKRKGKGKEPSRANADSNLPVPSAPALGVNSLVKFYCELWMNQYKSGRSPSLGGKDIGNLKRLLADHGFARAQVLIEAYLQMPDSWFVTKAHDVSTLVMNLNKVSLFADSGKMISKAELRDLDNKVAQNNMLGALERGEI